MRRDIRNFQNLSRTLLWMPSLVTIVSALLAMTSRIGQIEIVSKATRMTGTKAVTAVAVSGLAVTQAARAGMKPEI